MRKILLTIAVVLAFATPAQARQNYTLDQVQAGTLSWVNTFYPDAPADGFKRSGNLHCDIFFTTPHTFACDVEIEWRDDKVNDYFNETMPVTYAAWNNSGRNNV